MELLCVTGVEDQLQADVRPTLELLRNAGIKVQSLTTYALTQPHISLGIKRQQKYLCAIVGFFINIISLTCVTDMDADRGQARDSYMHS